MAGLAHLSVAQSSTLWFTLALWPLSAMGITAGAHRLWAHKCYEAAFPLRFVLMLLQATRLNGISRHVNPVLTPFTPIYPPLTARVLPVHGVSRANIEVGH